MEDQEKAGSFFAEIGKLGIELSELFDGSKKNKKALHTFLKIVTIGIDDPRVKGKVKYPMSEIIVMVFFGIMGGMRTIAAIQRFCKKREDFLKEYVELKQGIPSEDTIMRVFSIIDLSQLEQATVGYLVESFGTVRKNFGIQEPNLPHFCVDGKEARGTGRKYGTSEEIRNVQTLHVYDVNEALCLISRQIDTKTNEIPVAQEVLKQLNLNGVLVTFDALHMQKETVHIIVEKRGYFLGGLKGNQQFLNEEAKAFFTDAYLKSCEEKPDRMYVTTEKAHGNFEKREFFIARVTKNKGSVFSDWKGIKAVVLYRKTVTPCTEKGKASTEIRYYATNLTDVYDCGTAIRRHWEIENKLHWHLDVNMKDDENQTVNRNASGNLTLMKKMALSLFKLLQPFEKKNTSLNMITIDFIADYEGSMRRLLSLCDDRSLKKALDSVLMK